MFGIFRKPVTVTRTEPGAWVGGFWVEGQESTFGITASVQPATQLDMQLLPEGRRLTGSFRLFTDAVLFSAVEGTDQNADRVTIGGTQYEIMAVMPWQNNILNHHSYLVSRVTEGGT